MKTFILFILFIIFPSSFSCIALPKRMIVINTKAVNYLMKYHGTRYFVIVNDHLCFKRNSKLVIADKMEFYSKMKGGD